MSENRPFVIAREAISLSSEQYAGTSDNGSCAQVDAPEFASSRVARIRFVLDKIIRDLLVISSMLRDATSAGPLDCDPASRGYWPQLSSSRSRSCRVRRAVPWQASPR